MHENFIYIYINFQNFIFYSVCFGKYTFFSAADDVLVLMTIHDINWISWAFRFHLHTQRQYQIENTRYTITISFVIPHIDENHVNQNVRLGLIGYPLA